MTKDVLLTISGLHTMVLPNEVEEDDDPIEVITPAKYYLQNGKHYILYEEPVEGITGTIKNRIKITKDTCVEIMKSGITNAHMVFEKNKQNLSYYDTPYGQLQIGVHTRKLDVDISDELIDVVVEYGLDVNHEAAADCHIHMTVRPKAEAEEVIA